VSIYKIIQQTKRREQRNIKRILDQADRTQTTKKVLVGVFQYFLRSKFESISVGAEFVRRMVEAGHKRLTVVGRETLDRPIYLEKLLMKLQEGRWHKALGEMELVERFLQRRGRGCCRTC
jgi:hypothetical protein